MPWKQLVCCSTGLMLALALAAAHAHAQEQAPLGRWHEGVTPERKQRAAVLFKKGVLLHKKLLFGEAAATYEQALRHWDHPRMRFHLGLALMKTGQLVEAHRQLREALQWGPAPFKPEQLELALAAKRELESQLAGLEVRCDEPGARIRLNGKDLFTGPGQKHVLVLPDEYVISAEKQGYHRETKPILLSAGKQGVVNIHMSIDRGIIVERRWKQWKPWATVGAGVAMGLAGAALEWHAARRIDEFDETWTRLCTGTMANPGCYESQHSELIDDLSRARWEDRIAIGALIAGGTAVLVGLTMVGLNQSWSYRDKPAGTATFELEPMISLDTTGISTRFVF